MNHLLRHISRMRPRRGQTMTEFCVAAAMVVIMSVTLVLLLAIFSEWGRRLLLLIAMEYP